ncbi:MAG: hypothetical protein EOO09_12395 [Chitinophagaceae bacterium]|nr:MAG: hypothetical protein EOO09_12395 [Chitinophagaceae bacterium]
MNRKLIQTGSLALALVAGMTATAQSGADALRATFEKTAAVSVREKLFVHTDRDFYLAGEICWFRIFAMDAYSNRPEVKSRVCYVEVIDARGKAVPQAKIAIDSAGGSGSFYLPVSLATGHYTLRAYTSWMKNAGAASFFEKNLTIVNTLKTAGAVVEKAMVKPTVAFYPEGGRLVGELESRVAFRIRQGSNEGIAAGLVITTDLGDTIARTQSNNSGMGAFIFTPESGRSYRATLLLADGRTQAATLPEVVSRGYNIMVKDDGNGSLDIVVKSNDAGQQGNTVYLLGHNGKKVYFARQKTIQLETSWQVSRSELAAGITTLTLFDYRQQPVAERLVFNNPGNTASLTLASDKKVYGPREKISLSLQAGTAADYSASVFLLDSFQSMPQTISDYLLLTGQLTGAVSDPAYYFSSEPGAAAAADMLMMTAGWRGFRKELPPAARVAPENSGHNIFARVISLPDEKPASGVICFLSAGASPYEFLVSASDSSGLVRFTTTKYFGPADIYVQAQPTANHKYRVDVMTPFVTADYTPVQPFFAISKNLENQLQEKSIAMQAMNVYSTDSISRFSVPVLSDTLPFYGTAEFSYKLDDYKRFVTMEEVMREYISPVGVVSRNGKLMMNIYDPVNKVLYDKSLALVLVDGIPLPDPNDVFRLDPMKIRRIDVIPAIYMYGPSLFTGVVSLESYKGHAEDLDLDPTLVRVDYEGLQLRREFYAPDYSTASASLKRIPDPRNTLQWIPDGHLETGKAAQLGFYSSDTRGRFVLVVNGLTADGSPVSGSYQFTVE